MKMRGPEQASNHTSTLISTNRPSVVAWKWARWPAVIGFAIGISGAMKGAATIQGKILLAVFFGGLFAAILGGITYAAVFLVIRIRG